MKAHPTDKDLLKAGTRTKATPFAVVKTLVTGMVADLPRIAGRLWRRLRR